MPRTDAELVEEARRGQPGARDELVRRYQRQTALLAGALVNDLAEGEDLGQEAFVRAFRNLDLLADPARFAPWLRRIAFGVSIDWLRSFRPDLYRGWDDSEASALPDVEPSPIDRLLGAEMAERVARALAALPPRYRVPIRLFHLDGLSHSKIAETLGVPVGTARSLVTRARRKLAQLLASDAPDARSQMDELFEEQKMPLPSNFLHVANGDCTTETIVAAGLPGTTSVWADVLHEGPVPGGLSDEELIRVRARYLSDSLDYRADPPSFDPVAYMKRWRAALDTPHDELILWYEHDLFDQLNLIQLLSYLGRPGARPWPRPVSLICIGSFPGRPDFKGLGQLTPDELASLLDTRQPVADAQIAVAETAWQAFRAPEPRALEQFLRGDTSPLPFLAPALARHLEEYPSTVDGLSRTERRLLELCRPSMAIRDAFARIQDGETAFYIADGSFFQVAEWLAAASPPLLAIEIESRGDGLPRGTLSLTETGRAVLDGEIDRVHRCGIDRWLGGVHLQGTGPTWRWNPIEKRIDRS
jgi:RNA polymerase sigma factor (sigma-70 family)